MKTTIDSMQFTADPLGGIDLSAINTTPKSKSGKVYPILPDPDGSVAKLASTIRELDAEADQITGSLEIHKAEARSMAVAYAFEYYSGKSEVESTVQLIAEDGKPVNVSLNKRCKAPTDVAALVKLMGKDAGRFLRKSFSIKVDGDKIPAEHAATLVGRMVELFAEFNCSEAMSATQPIVPTEAFFTERHTTFGTDVNMQIDNLMPVIAAVKAKVRR